MPRSTGFARLVWIFTARWCPGLAVTKFCSPTRPAISSNCSNPQAPDRPRPAQDPSSATHCAPPVDRVIRQIVAEQGDSPRPIGSSYSYLPVVRESETPVVRRPRRTLFFLLRRYDGSLVPSISLHHKDVHPLLLGRLRLEQDAPAVMRPRCIPREHAPSTRQLLEVGAIGADSEDQIVAVKHDPPAIWGPGWVLLGKIGTGDLGDVASIGVHDEQVEVEVLRVVARTGERDL